jgi:predicted pyridoxine 5'-phosphate oxidase superfamily flavin-nucleotide-binding protein
MKILITKELRVFLENKEFVNIATCDSEAHPNVAPKFLVTVDRNDIYFADYVFGRTFKNIQVNPQVSLATMDMDTLIGYQFNGVAHILEKGPEYTRILENTQAKQIQFSVKRVIEGVHREKKYKNFEVTFPDSIVIFKVNVREVVAINPQGHLERTKI